MPGDDMHVEQLLTVYLIAYLDNRLISYSLITIKREKLLMT